MHSTHVKEKKTVGWSYQRSTMHLQLFHLSHQLLQALFGVLHYVAAW